MTLYMKSSESFSKSHVTVRSIAVNSNNHIQANLSPVIHYFIGCCPQVIIFPSGRKHEQKLYLLQSLSP